MATGPYCYLIFCAICWLVAIYTIFIIPETKNKTFMEISQMFAANNNIDKDELTPNGHLKLALMNGYGTLSHYEEKWGERSSTSPRLWRLLSLWHLQRRYEVEHLRPGDLLLETTETNANTQSHTNTHKEEHAVWSSRHSCLSPQSKCGSCAAWDRSDAVTPLQSTISGILIHFTASYAIFTGAQVISHGAVTSSDLISPTCYEHVPWWTCFSSPSPCWSAERECVSHPALVSGHCRTYGSRSSAVPRRRTSCPLLA